MRLHLDTENTAGSAEATNTVSAALKSPTGATPSGTGASPTSDSNSDSVNVSSASTAWSATFSDRATRVEQLAAAVNSGSYRVSSASTSQSIVAAALANANASSAAV